MVMTWQHGLVLLLSYKEQLLPMDCHPIDQEDHPIVKRIVRSNKMKVLELIIKPDIQLKV